MCNPVTSKSSVLYYFLQDLGTLHFDQMFYTVHLNGRYLFIIFFTQRTTSHQFLVAVFRVHSTKLEGGVYCPEVSVYFALDLNELGFSRVVCIQKGLHHQNCDLTSWRNMAKKKKCIGYIKGAWEQSVCVCLTWLIILLQLHSTPSACLDMFGGMSMKGFKCSP